MGVDSQEFWLATSPIKRLPLLTGCNGYETQMAELGSDLAEYVPSQMRRGTAARRARRLGSLLMGRLLIYCGPILYWQQHSGLLKVLVIFVGTLCTE